MTVWAHTIAFCWIWGINNYFWIKSEHLMSNTDYVKKKSNHSWDSWILRMKIFRIHKPSGWTTIWLKKVNHLIEVIFRSHKSSGWHVQKNLDSSKMFLGVVLVFFSSFFLNYRRNRQKTWIDRAGVYINRFTAKLTHLETQKNVDIDVLRCLLKCLLKWSGLAHA